MTFVFLDTMGLGEQRGSPFGIQANSEAEARSPRVIAPSIAAELALESVYSPVAWGNGIPNWPDDGQFGVFGRDARSNGDRAQSRRLLNGRCYALILKLSLKIVRHPGRALRRLILKLRESKLDLANERRRLIHMLGRVYGVDGEGLVSEYRTSEFRAWYQARKTELARFPGPFRHGTTHDFDCETLYLLTRAMQPERIVETGVLYGGSSAHILAALDRNLRGGLYSIDLGNAPDEPPSNFFVPGELRTRWELILGDTRCVLPTLLDRLGCVDLFHHDSLHTHEHMLWEYETARARLCPGGVVTTHDLLTVLSLRQPVRRHPFRTFCDAHRLHCTAVFNTGLAWGDGARGEDVAR